MAQLPERLGKYQIRSVLGQGAMGIVYEAFDPDIERSVAIKQLHPHLRQTSEGQAFVERFRREAKAAARCNHPNIVTVFELGNQQGVDFIVMEYVQGEELKFFLTSGHRFSEDEALHIGSEVLQGLAAAHALGIVHRDIKPANIILLDSGAVKLADFGVARIAESDLTVAGNMVGTPSYMCPEGLRGQSVDHRADLYSLGMVLLEIRTGQKPDPQQLYSRPVSAFLDQVFASEAGSALGGDWQQMLRQALADDPQQRFGDADSFLDSLRALRPGDSRRAASTLAETVVSQRPLIDEQSPVAPTTGLSDETLHKLEQGLASYIGPMAAVLVRRGTASGISPDALLDKLASHIDNPDERNDFLTRARHCIGGDCSGVRSTDSAATSAQSDTLLGQLSDADISQIGRSLAHYLGPIALPLVKREAARAHSIRELAESLGQQISDEQERQAFIEKIDH